MADQGPRHRVVIVGGGFGGLLAAKGLRKAPCDMTLIDRRNFHLFQPLLYQVATGALSPANIASPLRSILRRQRNTHVLLGEVTGFDLTAKQVLLADGNRVPWDTLVLATGTTHAYFGHDDWAAFAPGLKSVEDATEIRRRVLGAFERAEREPDPKVREKLLTFVVVGGGPTGVEMAGSISELARHTLRHDFRAIDPKAARVVLVEGQPRVLGAFHPKSSERALKALRGKLRVEVHLDSHVTAVNPHGVTFQPDGGKGPPTVLPTETVIWAAGVKASHLGALIAEAVGVTPDRAGRVPVGPDCTVAGRPDVFVVGDLASFTGPDGKPLPGLAPVAMQQGQYVARVIAGRLKGSSDPGPFRYWDKGTMATISRATAVAETHGMRFGGFIAWLAWLFIHILYLARFENRVLVLFQWAFNYVTRGRAARLITGEGAYHPADPRRPVPPGEPVVQG
ncbi:MAG: NAD(P)/FAD-dependent oxidoreductase [Gemmataceae bacterium]|nr:NAD(P)/FAD-dependent oxidoreductase [Gemmataceae bacterium]